MSNDLKPIIVVANQKGGVGKSTLSMNLAGGLALKGKRVLVIDLDSQANLSATFRFEGEARVTDVFSGKAPKPLPTHVPGISILPADRGLSGVLPALMADFSLQFLLADYMKSLGDEVDIVVVDTPPTLGSFSTAGLLAATHLLIPLSTQFFSMAGTRDLMASVEKITTRLNPGLSVLGAVVTVCDTRSALSSEVLAKSQDFFGARMFPTTIGRSVKIEEAQVQRLPITHAFPRSQVAAEYLALTDEVLARMETGVAK